MRVISTVPVGHSSQKPGIVRAAGQLDLCDPRKLAANLEAVAPSRSAERMEINLLVKVEVGRVAFSRARVARVENPAPSGSPGGAATGRGAVDAGEFVR